MGCCRWQRRGEPVQERPCCLPTVSRSGSDAAKCVVVTLPRIVLTHIHSADNIATLSAPIQMKISQIHPEQKELNE